MRKKSSLLIVFMALLLNTNNLKSQNMKTTLSTKQKNIVEIAANVAVGDLDQLNVVMNDALDQGMTLSQIKEILIQMYAYCGFPRSLQGINTLMLVNTNRIAEGNPINQGVEVSIVKENTDSEKYKIGKKNLQQLTLMEEKELKGANAFVPTIDKFLKEHLFADIFERDVLTFQEREVATIAALAAMTGVQPMLNSHSNIGVNTGLSEIQVDEIRNVAQQIGDNFRSVFALGTRGSSDWFTGEVYVQGLVSPDQMENIYNVGQVTFMPGGRTLWHTHPIGQTLLVLEGEGWYQEQGKPAVKLTKGSVIPIPKDVMHWHGASDTSKMVHIAISNVDNGSSVTWGNPVSDHDYNLVNRK